MIKSKDLQQEVKKDIAMSLIHTTVALMLQQGLILLFQSQDSASLQIVGIVTAIHLIVCATTFLPVVKESPIYGTLGGLVSASTVVGLSKYTAMPAWVFALLITMLTIELTRPREYSNRTLLVLGTLLAGLTIIRIENYTLVTIIVQISLAITMCLHYFILTKMKDIRTSEAKDKEM